MIEIFVKVKVRARIKVKIKTHKLVKIKLYNKPSLLSDKKAYIILVILLSAKLTKTRSK